MKDLRCVIPIIVMGMQAHGKSVKNSGIFEAKASIAVIRKIRLNIERQDRRKRVHRHLAERSI